MQAPSCYAGCSTCCQWPVLATLDEAKAIVATFTPERRAEVAQLVRSWLERARPLVDSGERVPLAEWNRKKIPCPLLRGNLCSVYDNRPVACRTRLTSGPTCRCFTSPDTQTFHDSSVEIEAFLRAKADSGSLVFDHLAILIAAHLGIPVEPSGVAGQIVEIDD